MYYGTPEFSALCASVFRDWLADYLVVRDQRLFKADFCMRPELARFLDLANGMAGEW